MTAFTNRRIESLSCHILKAHGLRPVGSKRGDDILYRQTEEIPRVAARGLGEFQMNNPI